MSRKMKDSGIPWIGEIPEDWKVDLIGKLYSQRTDKVSDKDYPPLSVGKMGVVPQLENAAKTDNGDDRKLVCIGDFAINSRSDRRGACGISQYDGSVSLINIILTPRNDMNPEYYNWLFHSTLFADEFYKWGHGIVDDLWTTRWQEMKKISIPFPHIKEQQLIADYLDKKCVEIDELVSLQEKFIEELKEYKQSVITEAVTKGLDPNVEMKDSELDWISSIPAHWNVCRLKNVLTLKTGTTPSNFENIDESDSKINWYTPIDISEEGNVIETSSRKLSERTVLKEKIELFPDKTILFVGIGASAGKVGYTIMKGYSNQQITALIPDKSIGKYYFYFLIADRKRIHDNAFYTTLPIINNGYLSQVKVITLPLLEQQAIADYLDTKCAEIDQLIDTKKQKIEDLKEYKKSLIYECVTGKKDIVSGNC